MIKFDTEATGKRGRASWPLTKRLSGKFEIDEASGCWNWVAAAGTQGRGLIRIGGRNYSAYRIVYALHKGPFDDRLVLDHKCKNPRCVNPDHMEPVTQQVNVQRGNLVKDHCPQGHPYSGDNLYVTPSGHRQCRACRRAHDRLSKARKSK